MTFPCPPQQAAGAVPAPLPFNEPQRLGALRRYGVLDTIPEQAYDDLTTLASAVCRAPISTISLIDSGRQWFKSRRGLEVAETPRDLSFCAHAILQPDSVFEVPDALLDERFVANPLVTDDPRIRFYAGAPLVTPQGLPLGTICVLDQTPRRLLDIERRALESLARQVVAQLELRLAMAELERLGLTDSLTGLWNRRAFDRRLRDAWSEHAHGGRPMALLMVDLDHFKRINDDFGHPAGDAALRLAAQVAQRSMRAGDLVARFGGEEFAVILADTDLATARVVGERLRVALEAAPWAHRVVTASIGMAATVPGAGATADLFGLLAQADRALYAAKQQGRNQVQAFDGWY